MTIYLFHRVASPCEGYDDVVVALKVDDYLVELTDEGVVAFSRAKETCLDLYRIETWSTPTLFLVDESEWERVVKLVDVTLPEETREDVYDMEGWERADFDEQPEFLSARSECWTTLFREKGLTFSFYKTHEDADRETDQLDYATIRNLLNLTNRSN